MCKVCESMRFDSGPEVFVRVNRNYVLTEYIQNENDCGKKINLHRVRPDVDEREVEEHLA